MRILAELTGPVSIVRVALCDCTDCLIAEDPNVFLVASVPERERLWATVAHLPESKWEEYVGPLLEPTVPDGASSNFVIETGLALVGVSWDRLSPPCAMQQMQWWAGAPDWLLHTPRAQLWACRRVVFGGEVTRVSRALSALERFYRPDAPVARADLVGRSSRMVDGPPDMG